MQDNRLQCNHEDEIDLRELFKTIWHRKYLIVSLTMTGTIFAIFYTFFKNPEPIYEGKVLFEIGELHSESFGTMYLDNPNNLSEIIKVKLNIDSTLPSKTDDLIELSVKSIDKDNIRKELETAIDFIINRHKEKVKFYKNYIMSKQIGKIKIDDNPINKPKKKLIVSVAFITGFILSIFLVLLIDFIQSLKKDV
ncbi:Wzz/FepE/Etk N-terminal domain-containing protein [Arcobacter sp.]|uniref:Wzz/FepE/Etk N-terminal domain-containing protein n=1 Tax=Arcobacter sp. TaxID=1872629 RepID=UPI003D153565